MVEHLVHNERVKLQATGLNNTAIALFISGVVQTVLEASRINTEVNVFSAVLGIALLTFAAFLHRWALKVLGRLKEKEMEYVG